MTEEMGSFPAPNPIGFEGYEKRLEITFMGRRGNGLRALTRSQIDSILEPAQCTIVSQLSNGVFDSYVLSESSLFVYPFKIILKTCGTTKLLLSIPRILELASELSLPVMSAKYSRGSFLFPGAQPSPHRSFAEEVTALDKFFGNLSSGGNAYVISDPDLPNQNWHIYYACEEPEPPMVTLEMCMTGLDGKCASVFFKKSAVDGQTYSAKDMTSKAGISSIIPEMEICDFEFDPCGYSMNGIAGSAFSTIHVTPEDGFSYASYEAMGFEPGKLDAAPLMEKVLQCFHPSSFSTAVTIFGSRDESCSWVRDMDIRGYVCCETVEQELPGGALLVYRTFMARGTSPRSTLYSWGEEDEESEVDDVGGEKIGKKGINSSFVGEVLNFDEESEVDAVGGENIGKKGRNSSFLGELANFREP